MHSCKICGRDRKANRMGYLENQQILLNIRGLLALSVLMIIHNSKVSSWSITTTYTTGFLDTGSGIYYLNDERNLTLTCGYHDLNGLDFKYIRWNKYGEGSFGGEQVYFSQQDHNSGGKNDPGFSGSLTGQASSLFTNSSHSLTIEQFDRMRDVGLYQCVVCDILSICQSSIINVSAAYVIDLPQVSIDTSQSTLTEGDSFQMTCLALGAYPETGINYQWQFNSVYPHSPGSNTEYSGNIISIQSATYQHFGSYTCKVDGIWGVIENSTDITVFYSPVIIGPNKEIMLASIGSELKLNVTFQAFPNNVSALWTIVNDQGTRTVDQSVVSMMTVTDALHTYITTLIIDSLSPLYTGIIKCTLSNGFRIPKVKEFQLNSDLPIINQESLQYKRTSQSSVTLSWQLPEGSYTEIIIEQCSRASGTSTDWLCQRHSLDNRRQTSIELTEEPGMEYTYYLVVFQYNIQVARSEEFTFIEETDDSIFGIIAGVTAVLVVVIVLVIPLVLIQIMDCKCLDKKKSQKDDRVSGFIRRLKIRNMKKSKKNKDEVKVIDIEQSPVDENARKTNSVGKKTNEIQSMSVTRRANITPKDSDIAASLSGKLNEFPRQPVKTANSGYITTDSGLITTDSCLITSPKQPQINEEMSRINPDDRQSTEVETNRLALSKNVNQQEIAIAEQEVNKKPSNLSHDNLLEFKRSDKTEKENIDAEGSDLHKEITHPMVTSASSLLISTDSLSREHVKESKNGMLNKIAVPEEDIQSLESYGDFYVESSESSFVQTWEIGDVSSIISESHREQSAQENKTNIEVIHKFGDTDLLENDTDSQKLHVYEL